MDEARFDRLWRGAEAAVRDTLLRWSPRASDHEDRVVSTALRAWRLRESYDPARGSFANWACVLAVGVHRDARKSALCGTWSRVVALTPDARGATLLDRLADDRQDPHRSAVALDEGRRRAEELPPWRRRRLASEGR